MFKLIRDNIPEIIKKDGGICNYAAAQNDELYVDLLRAKLIEEVNEFLRQGSVEELADVMSVISALVEVSDMSKEDYQKMYDAKMQTNGGFEKRLIGFFPDPQPETDGQQEQNR